VPAAEECVGGDDEEEVAQPKSSREIALAAVCTPTAA